MPYEHTFFLPFDIKAKIKFCLLQHHPEFFNIVVLWTKNTWGYMNGFNNTENAEIASIKHNLYIALYANQPIGMFALNTEKTPCAHLTHVYVESSFRCLGVGSALIAKAKELAQIKNAKNIVFETTTSPALYGFYQRRGAVYRGENYVKENKIITPTLVFEITI